MYGIHDKGFAEELFVKTNNLEKLEDFLEDPAYKGVYFEYGDGINTENNIIIGRDIKIPVEELNPEKIKRAIINNIAQSCSDNIIDEVLDRAQSSTMRKGVPIPEIIKHLSFDFMEDNRAEITNEIDFYINNWGNDDKFKEAISSLSNGNYYGRTDILGNTKAELFDSIYNDLTPWKIRTTGEDGIGK